MEIPADGTWPRQQPSRSEPKFSDLGSALGTRGRAMHGARAVVVARVRIGCAGTVTVMRWSADGHAHAAGDSERDDGEEE